MQPPRLVQHGGLRRAHQTGRKALHQVDGPGQIDGGRPRVPQRLHVGLPLTAPVGPGRPPGHLRREHHAVGAGDADGRRATHHHIANGRDDTGHIGVTQPALLARQASLIKQHEGLVLPVKGGNGLVVHRARLCCV